MFVPSLRTAVAHTHTQALSQSVMTGEALELRMFQNTNHRPGHMTPSVKRHHRRCLELVIVQQLGRLSTKGSWFLRGVQKNPSNANTRPASLLLCCHTANWSGLAQWLLSSSTSFCGTSRIFMPMPKALRSTGSWNCAMAFLRQNGAGRQPGLLLHSTLPVS